MGILVTVVLVVMGVWLFIKVLPILGILLFFWVAVRLVKAAMNSYSESHYSGSGSFNSYVLNKKSGVIHDRWDSSVDTISSHHQKAITSSKAWELVNRGTRYRFKQDP